MALPSSFKIEIENAALSWIDITASVQSLSDGTTSKAQIVSNISLGFGIDADDVQQYLDPTVNPERPRLRVTENLITTYYLFEDTNGTVSQDFPFPTATGRAYAGRIVDFPLLTYVPQIDLPMSSIVRQICVEDVNTQSGDAVAVEWLATQDPTVPGKRIEFNRATRLGVLRDLAASCGAAVRVSLDGMGFEVFDVPGKDLSDSATFDYGCPLSLSYNEDRIDKPQNAVRVKGAAFDYSLGTIPVINVWVAPDSILADGISSTTAAAQVFDESGTAVQHSNITDEAIDADSFTIIPVSGCYAVTAIWLNTGTQSVPIKGLRIDYTTFDASTITVPDNGTDLFIVSYVQAESVSWNIQDYSDKQTEAQTSTGSLAVSTTNPIGTVLGVFRASDTRQVGTDYFTGGSFTPNTTAITLGISPGATGQALTVVYTTYNATPLTGLNVSPTSSLCNANGIAETTVGSGTDVGSGLVIASSLGQQGEAQLSLTGSDVDSLILEASPARIRASIEDETVISEHVGEVSQITVDGTDKYIEVDNPVYSVVAQLVSGFSSELIKWQNVGTSYRVYVATNAPGGTSATVRYFGFDVVSEEDKTSVITATVLDDQGAFVTDGTEVFFEIRGSDRGCTLSSPSATTTDGVATVSLTAGTQFGLVKVRAIVGGLKADVSVEITYEDAAGGNNIIVGESGGWSWETEVDRRERTGDETCNQVPNDSNGEDGDVDGTRRIVDCDGVPIAGKQVTMNGVTSETDADGYFTFGNGSSGANTVTVDGVAYSFQISPEDSDGRGGYKIICTDDEGNTTYEGPA